MAEEETSQEKTEKPTEKRKEESRKKGQTARSRELGTAAVMVTGAVALWISGESILLHVSFVFKKTFSAERALIYDSGAIIVLFRDLFTYVLSSLTTLFVMLVIATVVGATVLGGWVFSLESLAPKFSKMNPVEGVKRIFSVKGLMEMLKALAKFLLLAGVSILLLNIYLEEILFIRRESLFQGIAHGANIIIWIYLILCCSLFLIAVVDIPFQVWQHNKELKMTKQQIKEEMKDSEGKPEVKSKIRQTQMEMTQKRMMAAVPDADVVITNPTHYSVALKYNGASMAAPVLVAKGVDHMALKIREIAKENKVPIVEAPILARSVYHSTPLDKEIPVGLYVSVAQVLAYIYQLEMFARGQGPMPKLKDDFDIPDDLIFD